MMRCRMQPAAGPVMATSAILFMLTACADGPVRPIAVPHARATVTAGHATDESRCYVVSNIGGSERVVSIPRATVLPLFPAAELVKPNAHGNRSLHVVSTQITDPAPGSTKSAGIACLASLSIHNDDIMYLARHERSKVWQAISAVMSSGEPATVGRSEASAAADALMRASIGNATPRRRIGSAGSVAGAALMNATGMRGTGVRPSRSSRAGIQRATRSRMRNASLTHATPHAVLRSVAMMEDYVEVTIWNTGSTIYLNDTDLWNWLRSYFDWDGTFAIDDYVDCEQASAEWFTMQDELAAEDADSSGYDNAVQAVENYKCVPQGNSQKTCIDMFIAAKSTGPFGIFNGDNRSSDPNAGYLASRIQVYFDLDNPEGTIYVNASHSSIPFWHYAKPDTAQSGAWIWATSDSTRVIQIAGFDGYCQYIPLSSYTEATCPAIDAFLRFTKRNGEWVVAQPANDVLRDTYPTMDIYHEDASHQFQSLFHSPETSWTQLYTSHATKEEWRRKMGVGLPPGCYYQ